MKKYIKLILSLMSIVTISIATEENTDRPGHDYKNMPGLTVEECQEACEIENKCKVWTFVKPNTIQGPKSHCYLKDSPGEKVFNRACVSGISEHYRRQAVRQSMAAAHQARQASHITRDELERFIAEKGRYINFKKNSYFLDNQNDRDNLIEIINKVNQTSNTKLVIAIKKKAAGLAKGRVDYLKYTLAKHGLIPRRFNVHKITRKDKKKRKWLSKNHHLWIRVTSLD